MRQKRWIAASIVALALLVLGSRFVRYIPEGELGIARSTGSNRTLPPGFHLVNPLRESFDRIPAEELPVEGIVSIHTIDGFDVRIPYRARIHVVPTVFQHTAVRANAGESVTTAVSHGLERALEGWGSAYEAATFLEGDLGSLARRSLHPALKPLGLGLASLVLQRPDPDIYLFLAENALARRDPEGPLLWIEAALEEQPDDWRIVTARGMLFEAAGDWPAAEELYHRALSLQPGAEDPLGRLYLHLEAEGKIPSLQRLLQGALEANPGSVRLHNWLALTFVDLGHYGAAIALLEEALALDPTHDVTLNNLGSVYYRLGNHEQAIYLYREALEANPGGQQGLINLGLAEFSGGDLPEARRALEAARDAGTGTVKLHNLLAEIYRRSGLKEEATQELLASYQLDPKQEGLHRVLTNLLGHPPDPPGEEGPATPTTPGR